jgi:hypothetical protein
LTPKTTRLTSWEGPPPEAGHFLRTDAGATYLVLTVRPNTRPEPKSVAFLHLGKLDRDEIDQLPADAVIHGFAWNARPRRGA